jgi:hypothetical protein
MIIWTSRQALQSNAGFLPDAQCVMVRRSHGPRVFWSCRKGGTWGLASRRPLDLCDRKISGSSHRASTSAINRTGFIRALVPMHVLGAV